MSREEALSALRECQKCGDKELAHIEADQILCTLLTQEGFNDGKRTVITVWSVLFKAVI